MPQPEPSANCVVKRSRLTRFLLLAGIMLVAANLRAPLTSVGPLLEQIQHQLMLSATAAGLLNSLPLILFAVLSPLTPSLAKRIGIERTLGAGAGAAGRRDRAAFTTAGWHAVVGNGVDRPRPSPLPTWCYQRW
ncbi:Inner membrane transport protein YeaN [Serratia fonticola]|uniref:Inner membrane transport protein YeaN n=1 Tax=Serratia fonticola TaxID=47917 RepID=A0A4U9V4H1_SERFO|nr:Inner membrane transport protein YeaN [Serratia fonticola]